MSGLAGWVDHQRDLSREGFAVAAMTARLAARGRNGEGLWSDRHLTLGHRADGIDPHATAGPEVVVEDGRTLGAITFDGALTNAAELRTALAASGRTVRTRSDAGTVLHAVLAWGPGAAARLEGLFAFAAWDARTGELLLCRDRLGIKPLSYARLPDGGLAFASELAALVEHPLIPAELDMRGLCSVLSQVREPGRAVLRGVHEVRAAHVVCVRADGIAEQRYWGYEARPHEHDLDLTVRTARGLLEEAIGRDAVGGEPAVLLSGGLDSSALAGFAAALRGSPPRTFTVDFGGDRAVPAPDRPFALDVVRRLGCHHQDVAIDPGELTDPVTEAAVLAAKDAPNPFGDKNLTPYLFYRRIAEQERVVLSGEAADAAFGGLFGAGEPVTARERTFPWIERAHRLGMANGIGNGLFDPDLLHEADLSGHCAALYQEARAEVPHLDGSTAADRRAREIDYLHMTRLHEQAVQHSERLAAAVGLQVRFPFADHRLLVYLYNVPWQMKSFDGREKDLLRTAARDLLPESVLTRPKVPFPITYHPAYKQRLTVRLRALLEDTAAPVRPLLDRAAARRVADDPRLLDRGGWLGRADVEFVLHLDAWLRRLPVRLAL
ncbi:asparagine synthase (glutamine-hydrolyzing) [Streptomyces sp. ISL-11]|uniref:asparagine synthase (glutamine-hydrolyzing) n=1 Tax=Streptomyces sp. ISL-11 TaxID=2819174 RepID=UPI001BE93DBD|nr:asparagine synthase (glutamine-hydrolyzing) [Streptomyces sp. ISL-11]MBT2382949.1 asparagine synthase (glutamine-hydrolyzing) [Streptomyces sp. ISL-11]